VDYNNPCKDLLFPLCPTLVQKPLNLVGTVLKVTEDLQGTNFAIFFFRRLNIDLKFGENFVLKLLNDCKISTVLTATLTTYDRHYKTLGLKNSGFIFAGIPLLQSN